MPASLFGEMDHHHGQTMAHHPLTTSSILGGGGVSPTNASALEDQRALQLALELSMLGLGDATSLMSGANNQGSDSHHHSVVQSMQNGHHHHQHAMPPCSQNSESALFGNAAAMAEDLRNLLPKKSQNMTECVPVPSSEHVAEIVGRQGMSMSFSLFFVVLLILSYIYEHYTFQSNFNTS